MLNNFKKLFILSIPACMLMHGPVFAQTKQVNVNIDLTETAQTIQNFGASDAWSCQFVGNWPDSKKNKIAELLFSADTTAGGDPVGIALSLWRFNIGAGSAQQGNGSGIKDEWRREESFLDSNGAYDWTRQAGQLWFLKAAKSLGVNQFLGFCNSAPVQFTNNGKAFTDSGRTNLLPKQYAGFADYLATVIQGIHKISKVKFDYISPINEPQWGWSDGGQEGCPFRNEEIAGLVKALDDKLTAHRLDTKIIIPEAGSIDYLYQAAGKPEKGNEIETFFNPGSALNLSNLTHVGRIVAAHSYFTTSPNATAVEKRVNLARSIASINNLAFWQSEYCILGDNSGDINGSKRDLGIKPALYLAKVIYNDLTVANASAWQWWTAISAYDYKDGLIYIDKNKIDGNFYTSKMLWAMGNYSRFIRPGAKRIKADVQQGNGTGQPVLISAFKKGNVFTAVIVNSNAYSQPVHFQFAKGIVHFDHCYITSATTELKAMRPEPDQTTLLAGPESITTVTGTIN